MVFVMVAIASIFFLLADQVMRFIVTLVLGIGRMTQQTDVQTDSRTMTKRWYIVQAYSNFEQKVADSIRRTAKQRHLDTSSRKSWCPRRGHRGAPRPEGGCRAKILPGYVLVKMDLTDEPTTSSRTRRR